MSTRTERDTFGPIDVPADRLWGAQTQRSLEHFRISGERMPAEIIQALDRLSAGLETGRIYDRDVVTLGPALDRLGNAWVRRTSR